MIEDGINEDDSPMGHHPGCTVDLPVPETHPQRPQFVYVHWEAETSMF